MKYPPKVLGHRVEQDGSKTPIPNTIAPQVYTSVHDWKPVPADQWAALWHQYMTTDKNLDDWLHSVNHSTSYHLDSTTTAVIFYSKRDQDSAVSSPVLMTVSYANTGKVICFASTVYGELADPDRKRD